MRNFHLERIEDVTGVSGTGIVAEGTLFSDGQAVIHWVVGKHHTTTPHLSMESVQDIHSHQGRTRIVWHDQGSFIPDYVGPERHP
jgi:hypothetical protein